MANVQISAQELFEAIEELRGLRDASEKLTASEFKAGELDVWLGKAESLVVKIVPDDESYIVNAFRQARGRIEISTPNHDARKDNRDRAVEAKLPAIDEALAAGTKRLAKLAVGAGAPATQVTPPVAQMPNLTFAGIRDPSLRAIAVRDYRELRFAANYGMVKSKATLAGSVAEAALFDALLRANVPATELEPMSMGGLYQRAVAAGVIAGRSSNAVAAARDGRNFVHAGVEYRKGALTQVDADNALTTMYVVLQELGITT